MRPFFIASLLLASSAASANTLPGHLTHLDFEQDAGVKTHAVNVSGNPQPTLGRIGAGMHFDGANDSAEITQVFADPKGSFSLAAWVKLDSLTHGATLVSQSGRFFSAIALSYEPAAHGGSHGSFGISLATTDPWQQHVRIAAPFSPVAHVWYHVAAVVDREGREVSLYIDGARAASSHTPHVLPSAAPWLIARSSVAGKSAQYLAGSLDEVIISDAAWSPHDVETLYAQAAAVTPIRPPSVPLAVRSPYLSTWIPSENAPGTWPTFWTGATKALTGFVRVDGKTYVFMGAPQTVCAHAEQKQLEITATQTRYVFAAGGINLHVNFISPVEADDMRRLAVPLAYVEAQAVSADGHHHATSVYFDVSGEWAHGDSATEIVWKRQDIGQEGLSAFAIQPAKPQVLREFADYASWGTAVFAADASNVTWQSGSDTLLRNHFVRGEALDNSVDTHMPRPIHTQWPVFAYASDMGKVSGSPSEVARFALGHVRQPPVTYLDKKVPALWEAYWDNWQVMLADAMADLKSGALLQRANALDARISQTAIAAGGPRYAALCALVLRQAFAGTELVGSADNPWLFLKEISSNGNFQTVDVIYPSMPAFLYANPVLVRYLLTPLFTYAESGLWPQRFPEHDLGASYPNATAHNDGEGENMPIEESANMVLMTAAYLHRAHDDSARAFVTLHYATLKMWTDYLVENTLDPEYQNQTDDFTGFIGHSSNLALKGILGVGAMAQMAQTLGRADDARTYRHIAEVYMGHWVDLSRDKSGAHLKLAYDQDGSWSLKYNAFPDKLLGLGLVPDDVLSLEGDWYKKQRGTFGFPLDNRHTYTKADWEMWTAAATPDRALRQSFIDTLYKFANETQSRVPLTDWYEVHSGRQAGFQARPVMGSVFALMLLEE